MGKIYQVFVTGVRQERMTVDVADSEDKFNNTIVAELKEKLKEKIPGDVEELRVIFADKQLEDDKKLSDYGVRDKSTVMVVVRLPGGFCETSCSLVQQTR